jgi:hypothetical protein
MPTTDDMRWFKENFQARLETGLQGTPYTVDLMTALACQETGEIWPILRKKDLSVDRILELCVGDTLDAPRRNASAFPNNKAQLVAFQPNGQAMFNLARQSLVDMSKFIQSYKGAASNPDKFCHGYGIFQYDIQFFKKDPDYFLQKRYANFDDCLKKAITELEAGRKSAGLAHKQPLTDLELAHVAIAYNTGHFNPAKGLKQGFAPRDQHGNVIGPFYGEQIFDFIQKSQTVSVDTASSHPAAGGPLFRVNASILNLRSDPSIDQNNVKAKLPTGQQVQALSGQPTNGFVEVETDFEGQKLRGFVSLKFLTQV